MFPLEYLDADELTVRNFSEVGLLMLSLHEIISARQSTLKCFESSVTEYQQRLKPILILLKLKSIIFIVVWCQSNSVSLSNYMLRVRLSDFFSRGVVLSNSGD